MAEKAPRMSDQSIEVAVTLLDGWTGKLTWDRYLALLETEIGHRYSKVAMHNQPRIKSAWLLAQRRLKDAQSSAGMRSQGDAAIAELRRRIDELSARNERLEQENRDLLMRFRLWSHNAVRKGLTESDLNKRLPGLEKANGRINLKSSGSPP